MDPKASPVQLVRRSTHFLERQNLWIDQHKVLWIRIGDLKSRKAARKYNRGISPIYPLPGTKIRFPRRLRLWIDQYPIVQPPTSEELKLWSTLYHFSSNVFHPTVSQIPLVTRWTPFPRELNSLQNHQTSLLPSLLKLNLWWLMLHSIMERSIRVRRKPEVWLVERHLIDEEEDLIVKSELPYPILKVMICAANLAQFHSVLVQ